MRREIPTFTERPSRVVYLQGAVEVPQMEAPPLKIEDQLVERVLPGGASPSFFRTWRNSPVDRHVPTIEQCRLMLNSQIFVRRAGPAADAVSSRVISVGGIEVSVIGRGSAKGFAPPRIATAGPAALTLLLHA